MIIGITGTNASGKGTVAKYIASKGFKYYSLSDELRMEMRKMKIKVTRDSLIKAGKLVRQKKGRGYLAKKVLQKIKGDAVVDSIRNTGEITALKRNGKGMKFHLIATDAPVDMRFKRAKKRGRGGDALTLQEFIKKENKELTGKGAGQQVKACMKKADFKIMHMENDIKKLYKKVDKILSRLK